VVTLPRDGVRPGWLGFLTDPGRVAVREGVFTEPVLAGVLRVVRVGWRTEPDRLGLFTEPDVGVRLGVRTEPGRTGVLRVVREGCRTEPDRLGVWDLAAPR